MRRSVTMPREMRIDPSSRTSGIHKKKKKKEEKY
jgi:hypothetical protein